MGLRDSSHRIFTVASLTALLFLAVFSSSCKQSQKKEAVMPPPPTIAPAEVAPWKDAASKVEEDRGEAIGRKAVVNTPEELKHYSDRRRFLAVQVAEVDEHDYDLPHDYAELVEMIREDNLVEMEPVGKDYVLYGVGANASDEPFAHYDRETGENILLYPNEEGLKKELDRLAESVKEPQAGIAKLESELKKLTKRDRKRRAALQSDISELRKKLAPAVAERKRLEAFYKNEERRELLFNEWKLLAEIATDFGGKSYDLHDAAARRKLKVRLLSFLRPEARERLLEIARAYREEFDRPLPVTSLVRPEQYQVRLSKTNPNATRIAAPPHSTGLAFDIFYYYMTAAEQDFLMSVIAKMKSEGRVEALRENRNHIHIFAFADGQRPSEDLIGRATGKATPAKQESKAKPDKKQSKNTKIARSTKSKKAAKTSKVASRQKKSKPVASARRRR
jgi:hypothetical protein